MVAYLVLRYILLISFTQNHFCSSPKNRQSDHGVAWWLLMLHCIIYLHLSLSLCLSVLCYFVCGWSTKKSATSRARNLAKAQAASKGSQLKANADALQIQCVVSENKIKTGELIFGVSTVYFQILIHC